MSTNPAPIGYLPSKLAQAIGRMEGVDSPLPDRPKRDNNPGDIEYGNFAIKHGATGGDPRFAIFRTLTDGWIALDDLITDEYSNLTIIQLVSKYAPAVENNDNNYTKLLCEWLGCSPNTLVRDIH